MIDVNADEGGQVLRVTGELDADSVDVLRAALSRAPSDVRLDLSGCTFFDSTGVAALVTARADTNPRLTVSAMSRRVRRVLHLCDLLDEFAPGDASADD